MQNRLWNSEPSLYAQEVKRLTQHHRQCRASRTGSSRRPPSLTWAQQDKVGNEVLQCSRWGKWWRITIRLYSIRSSLPYSKFFLGATQGVGPQTTSARQNLVSPSKNAQATSWLYRLMLRGRSLTSDQRARLSLRDALIFTSKRIRRHLLNYFMFRHLESKHTSTWQSSSLSKPRHSTPSAAQVSQYKYIQRLEYQLKSPMTTIPLLAILSQSSLRMQSRQNLVHREVKVKKMMKKLSNSRLLLPLTMT